ncbi:MAG TPA: ABC transporter substrate-binding protein, partial [Gemmatimonadales bacterium]|nr:ABC transporter substrate-binding protein [Gemmatimonadales bacterium]
MSRTAHALVLLALAACARAGAPDLPPGSAPPGGDACALGDGATRADTLTLAPAAPVDPARAPNPASDAERLAFRQLYATLVQLDCTGAPRPGLAQAWRREDERTWSFLLRADATFWDGSPVLAEPVIAAWRSRPAAWEVIDRAGIASIAAAGAREIRVAFATPEDRAPALFAHPALAPVQPPGTGTWAVGAGPWRPAAGGAASPVPGSPFLRFAPAA